jgi:hypothetical protein
LVTSTPEPRENPSRTSNNTLVTEESDVATKVEEQSSDDIECEDVAEEMTPRKVTRVKIRHEIPRIWELEKPLSKLPVEIAPGILAV